MTMRGPLPAFARRVLARLRRDRLDEELREVRSE